LLFDVLFLFNEFLLDSHEVSKVIGLRLDALCVNFMHHLFLVLQIFKFETVFFFKSHELGGLISDLGQLLDRDPLITEYFPVLLLVIAVFIYGDGSLLQILYNIYFFLWQMLVFINFKAIQNLLKVSFVGGLVFFFFLVHICGLKHLFKRSTSRFRVMSVFT